MQVMLGRGGQQRRSGRMQMDAAYLGGERAAVEKDEFYWVSTALGSLKTALRSSCHPFDAKYAQRCLAEFEYRFNRRCRLADRVPRLAFVALRTPPMPERLLKHGLCQVVIRKHYRQIIAGGREKLSRLSRDAKWHQSKSFIFRLQKERMPQTAQ